ncbi:hypothetical protein ICG_05950 [Bacillus cereus BAG1X1-3]|nr:hypothetical protein ICG_05950 [Bacillus cereus BAG1X1-3]EOO74271.1 hypothetical protein IC7_05629 [Bacillus cereus BAG1O-1]PEX41154.1 DUF3952 domain-containing protein [Bacillus cereus]PFM24959.1 DUF3952 domain-containing protein [Bacillus cereus]PFP82344.1 DUF3952 domain-containing protein [Bacillus cereus]
MKKKKVKGMLIMTIVASLLGGCGSSKTKPQTGTKIEYERLVKALDEGDMKTVMSASDDGYAHLKEQMIFVTKEEKEDGTHDRTIYQTIDGIYNTKDKVLYGNTNQVLTTDIDSEKEKDTTKNYKKEDIYSTNIIYKNGEAQSENPKLDVSTINLIFEGLQGIVKMKPTKDIKEFSEPSSISYSLTESQFKEIINDNLKLEYDKFRNASIVIGFNSAKDTKDHPMSITEITLVVRYYKKNNQDKMLLHRQQVAVSFSDKVENTQNSKMEYSEYKNQFNSNK